MKVIGIGEKIGTYEGTEYHNVMIHCTKEDDSCMGVVTEVVKIKFNNVHEIFGNPMSSADWQALLGKNIVVNYNRYGTVQNVSILENLK